jgi:hypothetical protein
VPRVWQQLLNAQVPPNATVYSNALPEHMAGVFTNTVFLDPGTGYGDGQPGTYRWMHLRWGTLIQIR